MSKAKLAPVQQPIINSSNGILTCRAISDLVKARGLLANVCCPICHNSTTIFGRCGGLRVVPITRANIIARLEQNQLVPHNRDVCMVCCKVWDDYHDLIVEEFAEWFGGEEEPGILTIVRVSAKTQRIVSVMPGIPKSLRGQPLI